MSSAGGSMSSIFDPSMATVILLLADGTNITLPAEAVDAEHYYDVQTSINYGSQFAASLLLLILLPILTKPEKRYSPIFVLNCLSLLLNFVRLLLASLYFTGPWRGFYVLFSADYSSVPSWAYQLSISVPIMTIPLMVFVQVSLALQVQVVVINLRKIYRRCILGISICVAACAISFRTAAAIVNTENILSMSTSDNRFWILGANINATSASIFYFSAVFVTKLGLSLHRRYKLGLRKCGPMGILFTMGFQTLLIPAIFAILQYSSAEIPDMDSNILTAVVIFLPLSSIWASTSLNHSSSRNNLALPFHERSADGSTLQVSNSHASIFLRKHQRSSPMADSFILEEGTKTTTGSNTGTSHAQSQLAADQPAFHELGS